MLVALLAGCDPSATPAPGDGATEPSAGTTAISDAGGTLRWAIREPAGIVPSTAADDAALLVVDTLFDSLTVTDTDGTVRPCAAVRWQAFEDGRRWRFSLRRGARYHDGSAVVARDFVVSWSLTVAQGRTGAHLQDVVGYRAVRAGSATRLSGVRAIDRRTLEVNLTRPTMDLPAIVSHPALGPVPGSAADHGTRFAAQPIGNGPYRMAERWSSGQFIRVERVRGWRNGAQELTPARVREVVFRIIDPDAGYVAFQQGRIDVAPVPAGALQQALRTYGAAREDRGPGVVDAAVPSLYFLGMRVAGPPWDDPEVRRALSRAIDREALADAQQDLELDPARWIVPPAIRYGGTVFCGTCLHLPSLAAATFARAGVTRLTLTVDAGGGHERVADRIRSDLADVGVDLTVRRVPFGRYLEDLEAGSLALYRFGWQAEYPEAGAMLEAIVRSGAPKERGDGANYSGYASDVVDDLLDRARSARSPTRRRALWAEAEDHALQDQAIVPLFSYRQRIVVSERVRDLAVTPWGTAAPERARIIADPDIVS